MSALPPFLIKLEQELAGTKTKESVWAIINEYFSFFGCTKPKQELWQMLVAALTNSEMEEFNSTKTRYDLIFFYEFTLMLMEAVHLLNGQHSKE